MSTRHPARSVPIGENQKRSLATALALLDERLGLFEEYARGREIRSVMYEERNDLTTDERRRLRAAIRRARDLMGEMKQDLALPRHIQDVRSRVWGHSAGFWEILAEMESKRLRGYGEVAPCLAEYLDPRAAALLRILQAITAVAGGGHKRDEPGSQGALDMAPP